MESRTDLPAVARRLEGKVAIITGGASGIGECTVRLFCRHGAQVVVADIQDDLGTALCADIGPAAQFVHCDVTNEDDVCKAVDYTVATFGKLDIMHNNAGIIGDVWNGILKSTKADFERVLSVNLVGPFLGTKHAARAMIPARRGSIISTASVASAVAGTIGHAYTSSKHGVAGLTRNAAVELGRHGIRVNCVSPALLVTPLAIKYLRGTGLTAEEFKAAAEEVEATGEAAASLKGVRLQAEDVADAVLYLASDDARFVSGHNLVVDGGFSVVNPSLGWLFDKDM